MFSTFLQEHPLRVSTVSDERQHICDCCQQVIPDKRFWQCKEAACDWNVCFNCCAEPTTVAEPAPPDEDESIVDDNPCGLKKELLPPSSPATLTLGGVATAILPCGTICTHVIYHS